MKYTGRRNSSGDAIVEKDGKPLPLGPSLKLWNHSPTGFNWGYGGSGPAQLALAILLDVTKDPEVSIILHQPFKWDFVAKWGEAWEITRKEIIDWIKNNHGAVEEVKKWVDFLAKENLSNT